MSTKIQSMKLPELQKVAENYQIDIQYVSERTGNMINKTKAVLTYEIKLHEELQRHEQQEIKKQEEIKQEEIHQTVIDSLETDGKQFYDDETPSLFLIWSDECLPKKEEKKKAYLEPSHLESKFNITLTFGSFLRFQSQPGYTGSDYYIVGVDKKIIECTVMCQEESMNDTEHVIIPREITKYLKDTLSFFYLKDCQKYNKKVRSLPKDYVYTYSLNEDNEDMEKFLIANIQLSPHDIYLHKHVSNIELDSPILFDYRCSSRWTEYDYKLFVFIPYLGKDGQIIETEYYEQYIDTYIDIYGKYSFLNQDIIDFQILKSIMIDYQTTNSTLKLMTDADLDIDDEPPFGCSLEMISEPKKYEEGKSKFREASYLATTYEAFLANKNIIETWKDHILTKKLLIMKNSFDTSTSSPLEEINRKYRLYLFDDDLP